MAGWFVVTSPLDVSGRPFLDRIIFDDFITHSEQTALSSDHAELKNASKVNIEKIDVLNLILGD